MSDIAHQPCPYTACGSSDAFSYNTDGYGKCHACNKGYPSRDQMFEWAKEKYPLTGKKGEKVENVFESYTPKRIETPSGSPVRLPSVSNGKWVAMRGITAQTMEDYGVKTYSDRQEYVYPSGGIKVRTIPEKAFYAKNGFKGDELFGMNLFTAGSSRKLTITEGELDALSVAQMMKSSYINPVVSLPSATPSKKLWDKCFDWVNSFEQIILSVDNDDAGNEIAARIAKLFPNKVYRVDHSKYKDANEFLKAGAGQEFKSAWFNAKKYTPENILNTCDQFLKLYQDTPNHQYVETGIRDLDDKILGLMQGHFTVFKAPTGIGKSLAPDTKVLKYDGSVVKAIDVKVGDKLMGPDSKPRNVTNVNVQTGPMYRVTPTKGEPFECNADHILSLRHTSTGEIKNVLLTEYLNWSKTQKHLWKLWRTGVDFQGQMRGLGEKWAYALGVYLGDGRQKGHPELFLGKKKQVVFDYLVEEGLLEPTRVVFERGCYYISFSKFSDYAGVVQEAMLPVRHIPEQHKVGDKGVRMSLLAGLLDTDGSLTSGGAEITQKSEVLADDICFVARSLGLAAYKKEKVVNDVAYYRVTISGDLTGIPCKRLKFEPRRQSKNVLNTGFTVEPIGTGEYRGIMLDGDHLFLLGDFTVTHNTELMRYLEYNMLKKGIPIAAWHLEETKLRSLLGLVSYELNDNVTRRDLIEEKGLEQEVVGAIKELTKDENFYQFYLQDGDGAEELCDQIRYFSQACDVKYVFFEPIQDVIVGSSDESKEQMLADLSVRLSKLAAELNVGIVSIGHTNDNGDFKYCRMIGQRASVIVNLHRDKESTELEERNTTHLHVEKNRPTGEVGNAGRMRFNNDTFTLREVF